MAKKKKDKRTNNYLQNITQKKYDLKQHESYWKPGWTHVFRKGIQVLLHMCTP